MTCRAIVSLIAAALTSVSVATAQGAELPKIMSDNANAVPTCATPGRMMAFLTSRNSELNPRFEEIAVDYMRHGQDLELRWDIAFFQMMVETGNLKFGRDVKPDQNNFAGLGATGNGKPGERFSNISDGVRAHLEHVAMYAGKSIEDPVAERTQKVQSWGILNKWRNRLGRSVSFSDLTRKWAPGDRGYSRDIAAVTKAFYDGVCKSIDPRPDLLAKVEDSKKQLADQAMERSRNESVAVRSSLGAGGLSQAAKPNQEAATAEPEEPAASDAKDKIDVLNAQTAQAAKKCRVWTASYGGTKALIIKADKDQVANYTVLDVNEGNERREADAYIAAYAQGGATVGTFSSQSKALDKAFELCPEG